MAVFLFILVYFLLFYFFKKKPGVILTFFLLFPSINNIILFQFDLDDYRYLFGFFILIIFIVLNFNPKIIFNNLNYTVRSPIFIGLMLILFGMFVGFLNGNVSDLGQSIINKFLMPILIMFLIGALFIKNNKMLEDMSFGFIIFGTVFYIATYFLADLSSIDVSNRWSITETGFFNAITLARMCGMIFIPSFLYGLYTKVKIIRIISIVLSLISIYWLFAASTRGVIVAILLSLLLFFLFNFKNKGSYKLYIVFFLLIIIISLGIIDISKFDLIDRFYELKNYKHMPRYWDFYRTWNIFKENIFFGAGPGGYGDITGREYPHNIFLELIAEYGLIGLMAFVLITYCGLYNSLKILRSRIFNYKINILILIWIYFLFSSMFSGNIAVNNDFWIMSGVLISVIRQNRISNHRKNYVPNFYIKDVDRNKY